MIPLLKLKLPLSVFSLVLVFCRPLARMVAEIADYKYAILRQWNGNPRHLYSGLRGVRSGRS